MTAERETWRRAIELGARLGLFPVERLAEAIRRLDARGDASLSAAEVATWVGRSVAEVEGLRTLLSHLPADTPAERLHETVRLHSEALTTLARALIDPRSTPPTVPLADVDLPTAKLGAPTDDMPTLAPPSPVPHANIPLRLGPYVRGEELGRGGMGIVFRARHENLGSACALKVMVAGEHASAEAIARFQREAAMVARMGKHPNIVTVFDLGHEGAIAYYAMELVEGRSLRARMREREHTPQEAAALAEKVARAVHFAHGHGVIHRDLKPENVVVREDGEPQVMDFGLARDVSSEDRLSAVGQVMGTLAYMAPEQARSDLEGMDARTDVYALGGILYDLVTGIPPHRGANQAALFACILRGDILSPRKVRPDLPRDLETVCMKALSLDPSRRYASAEGFADDLARFLRGEPVVARPVGRLERLVRLARRRPVVSTVIAGFTFFGLLLLWQLVGPARILLETNAPHARVDAIGAKLWARGWVWPAGEVTFRVSAEGHETREVLVRVSPGTFRAREHVTLDLDHGFLTIATEPAGAEVFVDGKSIGTSPVVRAPVRNGRHTLSLRLADHEEWKDSIDVLAGVVVNRETQRLNHEQGKLRLEGCPRGVVVKVIETSTDTVITSVSPPVEVSVRTGEYDLDASLADHFPRRFRCTVSKNGASNVNISLNPRVLWRYNTGGPVGSTPALGDLDGDGCLDSAIGSGSRRVSVVSGGSGAVVWTFEAAGDITGSPALADLDRDAVLDCVAGSLDGAVYALSGRTGSPLWIVTTGGPVSSAPALGDLNGDGVPDVVVGSDDRCVHAISGIDGRALWRKKTGDRVRAQAALADLDGSGSVDCVIGSDDNHVYRLSGRDGRELWTYRAAGDVRCAPALGDLDLDGVLDCVVGSGDGRVYALSGRNGSVLWAAGTSTMSHAQGIGARVETSPVLADVDDDGVVDCIGGASHNISHCLQFALSGKDGTVLWEEEAGAQLSPTLAVADQDFDGVPDAVYVAGDELFARSGRDGRQLWSTTLPGNNLGGVRVADLDGDGRLDCVVGAGQELVAMRIENGPSRWSHQFPEAIESTPRLVPLDNKGDLDCVVSSDALYALVAGDGSVRWRFPVSGLTGGTPGVADLDGDGVPDLVVPSSDSSAFVRAGGSVSRQEEKIGKGFLYAISSKDASVLWAHEVANWCEPWTPALGDLNQDEIPDCVFGDAREVCAVSGKDGAEFRRLEAGGGEVFTPALGDLDGDGAPDCVAGTDAGMVIAVSGRTGELLWTGQASDLVRSVPAIADLNGDAAPDVVVVCLDNQVFALSGKDGSRLWSRQATPPGGAPRPSRLVFWDVASSPSLAELDGDTIPDVLMGTTEGLVCALSGGDGEPIWTRRIGNGACGSPALVDLDQDGAMDCVIGSRNGRLNALSGTDGTALSICDLGGGVQSSPVVCGSDEWGRPLVFCATRDGRVHQVAIPLACTTGPRERIASLARESRAENWAGLVRGARRLSEQAGDPWTRGMALLYLAYGSLWLGDDAATLRALDGAQATGLRAPECAAYDWICSARWSGISPERRAASRVALLQAMSIQPDATLDVFVGCQSLLTTAVRTQLWKTCVEPAIEADCPMSTIVAAGLLVGEPGSEGAGRLSEDELSRARQWVLARMARGQQDLPRLLGYLALLARPLEDQRLFRTVRLAYLAEPRRPEVLDRLLVPKLKKEESAAYQRSIDQLKTHGGWLHAEAGRMAVAARAWAEAVKKYSDALEADPDKEEYQLAFAWATTEDAQGRLAGTTRPGSEEAKAAVESMERAVEILRSFAARARAVEEGQAPASTLPPLPGWAKGAGIGHRDLFVIALETLARAYDARQAEGDTDRASTARSEASASGQGIPVEEVERRQLGWSLFELAEMLHGAAPPWETIELYERAVKACPEEDGYRAAFAGVAKTVAWHLARGDSVDRDSDRAVELAEQAAECLREFVRRDAEVAAGRMPREKRPPTPKWASQEGLTLPQALSTVLHTLASAYAARHRDDDWKLAARVEEEAIALNPPEKMVAEMRMALEAYRSGETERIEALLRPTKPSPHPQATPAERFMKLGRRAEAEQDWEKALDPYESALAADPKNPGCRSSVARVANNLAWGLATGDGLLPDPASGKVTLDPARAVTLAERAVALTREIPGRHEDLAIYLDTLAAAYEARNQPGDLDRAVSAEEEAVRVGPPPADLPELQRRLEKLRSAREKTK